MSVFQVILFAIVAMAGVAVMTLPLIVGARGWEAWQAIPREVYASTPQRVGRLRPIHLWITAGAIGCVGRIIEWAHQGTLNTLTESVSYLILGAVLAWHVFWAGNILRHQRELDVRLVRFAKYAVCAASIALLILLVGGFESYSTK
jgi:hypothetical protein